MNDVRFLSVENVPPTSDLESELRLEIMKAISAGGPPDLEVHDRIVEWAGSIAPNTLRAIRSDLRIADAFQRASYRPTLPLTPIDLLALIRQQAESGRAKSSISRLVASMVRVHAIAGLPPCVDDRVTFRLKQIRRSDTRVIRQARGLRLKGETRDVIADKAMPLSIHALLDSIPADPRGLRDRALISTAYDAGLRRSELVAIRVEHIQRTPDGEGALFIPRSKTDQESEGVHAWLSHQTVSHIDAWLKAAELESGFVFRSLSYRVSGTGRLYEGAVSRILKDRLAALLQPLVEAGDLTNEERTTILSQTSSHSMRVGRDQDLFAAGVDLGSIMQGLRWKNPKQPLAYARHLAPGTSKLAAIMRKA